MIFLLFFCFREIFFPNFFEIFVEGMGQKKWLHRVVKHREGSKISRIESWLVQNRQMGGPTALSICLSAAFGEPVSKQEVWCALTNLRWTKKLKSPVVGFSILSERQIYLRVLKSLWCCDGAIVFVDEKNLKKKWLSQCWIMVMDLSMSVFQLS